MVKTKFWEKILIAGLLCLTLPCWSQAQMNMNPYFTAINYPLEKQSLMLMALPDFQLARYGNDYFTGMLMAEYGITPRWTVAVMAEGARKLLVCPPHTAACGTALISICSETTGC